ncbi:MAG: metal-sulfur cluster assembly factor [Candidatus Micrarchaeota archaeon]
MVSEQDVLNALRKVIDPELGIDVVSLGFIYGLKIEGEKVEVRMTLTFSGCPLAIDITKDVEDAVKSLGVKSVEVVMVWDPPWTPDKMSDEAKKLLGFS